MIKISDPGDEQDESCARRCTAEPIPPAILPAQKSLLRQNHHPEEHIHFVSSLRHQRQRRRRQPDGGGAGVEEAGREGGREVVQVDRNQ